MNNFTAIILAAGAGTRMKSNIPKALQKVCGRSMIDHVIDTAKNVGCREIIVVTGCGKEQVEDQLSKRNQLDNDIDIKYCTHGDTDNYQYKYQLHKDHLMDFVDDLEEEYEIQNKA